MGHGVNAHGAAIAGYGAKAGASGSVGPKGVTGKVEAHAGPFAEAGGTVGTKHNRIGGGVTAGLGAKAGLGVTKSPSGNHLDIKGKIGASSGVGGYVEG